MKFKLIIDSNAEEEVVATLHERGTLSQQLEALIMQHDSPERLVGYLDDGVKLLHHSDIECIVVEDGKTYAIDRQKVRYRLRLRLYELEQMLPPSFIRINKSALANERSSSASRILILFTSFPFHHTTFFIKFQSI